MLQITKINDLNGMKIIEVIESTGRTGLHDVDPITGDTSYRVGTSYITVAQADRIQANPGIYHLDVTIGHHGCEFNRIHTPDGEPFLDLLGMYVYATAEIVPNIINRKDKDLRYGEGKIPYDLEEDHFRDCFSGNLTGSDSLQAADIRDRH